MRTAGTSTRVIGVFTGRTALLSTDRGDIDSGIFKRLREGPVVLTVYGLDDDENAERTSDDLDQAVSAYPSEHYRWWRSTFSEHADAFVPGVLGENLSTIGLTERNAFIGDVFEIGSAVCEIAKPRTPCRKVGLRLGIADATRAMRQSLSTGWYLRVRTPGAVEVGDTWRLVERPYPSLSVRCAAEAMYFRPADVAASEALAACDRLAANWRAVFDRRTRGDVERPE